MREDAGMPWVTFTADHVRARLAARELEVYQDTATEDAGDTPEQRLDSIVSQVCDQFRGAIRMNPRVTAIGAAGTLPDFCIAHAAVVARVALVGMNPVPEGMTDPRRDEYREAMKFLERLKDAPASLFDETAGSAPSSSGGSYGGSPLLDF
jgi:hypothetical protein